LANGLYLMQVRDNETIIGQIKFVVQD